MILDTYQEKVWQLMFQLGEPPEYQQVGILTGEGAENIKPLLVVKRIEVQINGIILQVGTAFGNKNSSIYGWRRLYK